jgi:hypothetical protein
MFGCTLWSILFFLCTIYPVTDVWIESATSAALACFMFALLILYKGLCNLLQDPLAAVLNRVTGREVKCKNGKWLSPLTAWSLAKNFNVNHFAFKLKHLGYIYYAGKWYRFLPADTTSSKDLTRVFWHPKYVSEHFLVLSVKGAYEQAMAQEISDIVNVLFEFDFSRFNFGQRQTIRRILRGTATDLTVEEKIEFLMKNLASGSTRTTLIKYLHVISIYQTQLAKYG